VRSTSVPHWVELVTQTGPPTANGFAWLIKHIRPQLLPGTDLLTARCVGVRRFGMRGSIGAVTVFLGSSSLSQRAYLYAGQVRWLGGSDAVLPSAAQAVCGIGHTAGRQENFM